MKPKQTKEIIYHTTRTKLKFPQRLRLLFGATLVIDSEIYTSNDSVTILGSSAKDRTTWKD